MQLFISALKFNKFILLKKDFLHITLLLVFFCSQLSSANNSSAYNLLQSSNIGSATNTQTVNQDSFSVTAGEGEVIYHTTLSKD